MSEDESETTDADDPRGPSSEAVEAVNEPLQRSSTLLPRPLASAISCAAAISGLALRIGKFYSVTAINGARIGTLSSIEIGRTVIEGILSRAGSDVVDASRGIKGREEAEGVARRILESLHYTFTSSSFLISAAFQLTQTGIESGLTASYMLVAALDAVFGKTDTSKAVAAIVTLVQREAENQETILGVPKVGFRDFLTGLSAFVLLQGWERKNTEQEFAKANVLETVWDIVVVNTDDARNLSSSARAQATQTIEPSLRERPRSTSFVSATGDHETLEGIDGISLVSGNSYRPLSSSNNNLQPAEEALETFSQRLLETLNLGPETETSVHLTADSVTRDRVLLEVHGNTQPLIGLIEASSVELNLGFDFNLIAVNRQDEDSATFVFQRVSRKRRYGRVEVGENDPVLSSFSPNNECTLDGAEGTPKSIDPIDLTASQRLPAGSDEMKDVLASHIDSEHVAAAKAPVTANQKRTRNSGVSRPEKVTKGKLGGNNFPKAAPDQSPLRKALNKGKSVRNLVEFWGNRERHPNGYQTRLDLGPNRATHGANLANVGSDLPPQLTKTSENHILGSNNNSEQHLRELRQTPYRSGSMSHHKNKSSIGSINDIDTDASKSSLMLRPLIGDDVEDPVSFLARDGHIPTQYPRNSFTANAARFARFSVASYGSNFLRWTGVVSGSELSEVTSLDDSGLPEHLSFSTYTNLPSSTVLLSSFVEVQPSIFPNADSDSPHGLPLCYFISLDHASRAIVLTCRGTLGFDEILTDTACDYTNISWQASHYWVHSGIYASAMKILSAHSSRALATLKAALEEYPEFSLIICGHSVGGAVSSVLAILLTQRNTSSAGGVAQFVTTNRPLTTDGIALPPNVPCHAYTYGPAACFSSDLQMATRGLVTSFVFETDVVPYLSLGTLHDVQALSSAFKADSATAMSEIRKRIWQLFRTRVGGMAVASGFGSAMDQSCSNNGDEDNWTWSALRSLRASMLSDKLYPPGQIYILESSRVLQRHAFLKKSKGRRRQDVSEDDEMNGMFFRPATRNVMRHVRDVEKQFSEVRFSTSMFSNHFPGRYLKVLEQLDAAIGV